MHNLERVEAGLRGELWLAPVDFRTSVEEEKGQGNEMEWQDKDEFEREQDIEDDTIPEVRLFAQAPLDIETNMKQGGKMDKEARKAGKKARRKEEAKKRTVELSRANPEED
jgi:hypothetical protein